MATFDEFIESLERDFGQQGKGKPFEVFCKWFLENDPEWSGIVEKVWLWESYPDKWQGKDLGTDLVFRDVEGNIWAAQAKCYSANRSTTKSDLNSFLADAGRSQVHRLLWMQTSNRMEANAEASLKTRDKPVTILKLSHFQDAQIDYPSSFSELAKASIKEKPKAEPHQREAIEAAVTGLKTHDRGQLIMACGTGKTFTTLWIKEALAAHTTLVLLPSLSLLSQTMREWAWARNHDFKILNVCSDVSVGKKTEDMHPADAPFPVTSDIQEIQRFLRWPEPKVVFCTYQSSGLVAEAQQHTDVPEFDLAIADEAHRCAGKVDAGFATILDADKIRAAKRLFTTATPRYFGKTVKDEARKNDLEVVGMDNETVFGPVIHKLTFGEAIERELLTDYQVVIVGVDEPTVREWIKDEEIVSTAPDSQTDARTLAAKIGLIKAIKDYDLQRVISFHSRVSRAKEFSDEFSDVVHLIEEDHRPSGRFLSDYVSGEMKTGDRKGKIDRLKQLDGFDRGILTNARCLAEGVDVPALDGVAFIDPRGSQIEIIQAVGRAIRKVRGASVQKKGTIVIPVFIEDGDDPKDAIEASNFKPVWDVLKALRSHDEVLAETLDHYRRSMAKGAVRSEEWTGEKIIFDLPTSVGAEFSASLRTVLVEATTASWEFWFGLLEKFKEREGHCFVATKHKENDLRLGGWVNNQRTRRNELSQYQRESLERIGFAWSHFEEKWQIGFAKLLEFKSVHGHINVPITCMIGGYDLGKWVRSCRLKKAELTMPQHKALYELGFSWDPFTEKWNLGYEKLCTFFKREGNFFVSWDHKEDGFPLGVWVAKQRSTKAKLTASRLEKLEKIRFVWNHQSEYWMQGFSKLCEFHRREGHCSVPKVHVEDNFNLGTWVQNQRTNKNQLTSDRLQKLDQLGFVWNTLDDSWEQYFNILQNYKNRVGDCLVPQGYSEAEFSLGRWVAKQRQAYDTLPPDRLQRLNELGFIWNPHEEAWTEGYLSLVSFKEREGHCQVPAKHHEGSFKLGVWVGSQRSKKQRLNPEKVTLLDQIGFVWVPHADQWEKGFEQLTAFKSRFGHCNVPFDYSENGFKLGFWVGNQRQKRKRKALGEMDIQRLDDIGFTWGVR